MNAQDRIAVIGNREGLDSPALLSAAVAGWSKAGVRVVGLLAHDTGSGEMCSADFLRDIASNEDYSVRLDASPASTSCHLDADGMEKACAALLEQIPQADIVVLSKFGKLEAMQRGLWPAFTAAVTAGLPLLTTVSEKHVAAWKAFAPSATWMEPGLPAIEDWWQAVGPQRN